jgi:thymidylate synthase ThyX
MTANARVLESAIRKMLSHPLAEVRQIGEEIKRAAVGEVPTLVKYAEVVPYLTETTEAFNQLEVIHHKVHEGHEGEKDWCTLIDYDVSGENKILAAALYRFSEIPYSEAMDLLRLAPEEEKKRLAGLLLGQLKRHDTPLRELEHTSYTFDIIMDQGAYAEFKRHRMMTQTPQALTARLGYAIPRRITEAGFEAQYRTALEAARETYETLAEFDPQVASYVVPNGFNRRVLATFNLREAYHFCQLRAATNAHFSIRRVAQRLAKEIRRVHPLLAGSMRLPEEETWQSIEKQDFTSCG